MRKGWIFVCMVYALLLASCEAAQSIPASQEEPTRPAADTPTLTQEVIPSPSLTHTVTQTPLPQSTVTMAPTQTVAASPSPGATLVLPSEPAILIDHRAVELFEQIPEEYIEAARDTPMLFSDRSVGQNIDTGLECLASGEPGSTTDWPRAPAHCRRDYYGKDGSTWLFKNYGSQDYASNQVPQTILFDPDPVKHDRSNWMFEFRGGYWQELIENFARDLVPTYIEAKEVLSFQFSYLNIEAGSDIEDAQAGFFADLPHDGFYPRRERWDISDLEELERLYPEKTFIYWTTSLARGIGTQEGTSFNEQMRQYALAHGKVLFDVADIESHDPQGNPCYDNRDGVEYCSQNGCENHPDDGLDLPAICQDYTTETDGGHLGSVSGGKIRIAKALWVLMARLAGWNPP